MINTLNVGKLGGLDSSTPVDRRRDARTVGDAASSDFSRFLSDVLSKIDSSTASSAGTSAPAPAPSEAKGRTSVAGK